MNDRSLVSPQFTRALSRLREGTAEDPARSDLVIDGVIQRFEFCFELGWKLLKALLHHQGVECGSPRDCIKQAFGSGLIAEGEAWIDMLEARNRTLHLYDVEEARTVYGRIRTVYLGLLENLEVEARRLAAER